MQNELLDFVGDIYEASYKPGHWEVVMEKLCQLTGSKSSVLIIENQKSGADYQYLWHQPDSGGGL